MVDDSDFEDLLRKPIKDMSKEELVDEIVADWRTKLIEEDITNLKKNVIGGRVESLQKRLLKEAGLKIEPGHWPFSGPKLLEDDN